MKSNRKSLVLSVLSFMLCVALLLGTTYAWFTDSVTSGVNKIISGNLDVSLEYWNGTEYADATNAYVFDRNALWEPGRVEVAYLRVRNAGNLALKYRMTLSALEEVPGTNVDGEEFYLSDYLVFAMIDGMDPSEGVLIETRGDTAAALEHLTAWSKIWSRTSGAELYALVMGADIDMENTVLDAPIDLTAFKSFSGNYYTVKNVGVNTISAEEEVGLFKNLPATQKLSVSNVTVTAPNAANVGILSGKASPAATLSDITVSGSSAVGKENVGGVFGSGQSASIEKITLDDVSLTGSKIGGIAGEYSGAAEGVSKITIAGLTVDGEAGAVAGGIFGTLKDKKNFSISEYTITEITMLRTVLIGSVTGRVIGVYDTVISLDSAYVVRDQDGKIIAVNGMGKITLADFDTEKLIALAQANGMKLPQKGTFYNGHCYAKLNRDTKMIDGSSTGEWGHASDQDNVLCQSFGGHAATITSAGEEAIIRSLADNGKAFIGGMRSSHTSSDYHWLNGETFDMSLVHWAANEPSNDSIYEGKKYLAISNSGWMTAYRNMCTDFICEWDIIDLINH